jgi:hypothetical protein
MADRLQSFAHQRGHLKQRAHMYLRRVLMAKIGRRRLGHPDRNVEHLATLCRHKVGRWWPAASLPDPEGLAKKRMERVIDLRPPGIRSLSGAGMPFFRG